MSSYTAFLESALAREHRAQRFHIAFAAGAVLAGVALVAFVQLAPGELSSGISKLLLTLGGTFLSSLASLPLKEFFRRGDRLAALRFLLQGFRELAEGPDDSSGAREAVRFVQNGINLFHVGRYAQAVRAYDSALELDPANPYVVNLKGYSLLRAGDTEESVRALREAVEIDPDYAWGYFDLARALCAAERFDEARRATQEALRLRPGLRAQMSQDGEFRRLCEPILDDVLP